MKHSAIVVAASLMLISMVALPNANAQTPSLLLYFDAALTENSANCPSAPIGTVTQWVYLVLDGFDTRIKAIEFSIAYPSQITWMFDVDTVGGALIIGDTAHGIAIAWPVPGGLQVMGPTMFMQSQIKWMCAGCTQTNVPIPILPAPDGELRAVQWPDDVIIPVTGVAAAICPAPPVEESTWGTIKALYN
jgi:hypothetical protein